MTIDSFKQIKAFCPTCGELKIDKYGKIIHPEQDKSLVELLKNGFETRYVNADKSCDCYCGELPAESSNGWKCNCKCHSKTGETT